MIISLGSGIGKEIIFAMPELPEVETIRRDLESNILGQRIQNIEIKNLTSIKNEADLFKKNLEGNSIKSIQRIGKLLILELSSKKLFLCIHLRMTGQLILKIDITENRGGYSLKTNRELPNAHTRIIITFENSSKIFFNDIRKFGYMQLVKQEELQEIKKKFGIEPLTKSFNLSSFKEKTKNRKAPIKNILLNQNLIAGIGNIYADEICFEAKINPNKKANKLKEKDLNKLFEACNNILALAIKHRGTSFSDYRDAKGQKGNFLKFLKVYKREGQNCLTNPNHSIKKHKLAGRGTHFCPECQK